MTGSLHDQLQECVGSVLDPDRRGRDPVNVPMIRNWCDALGETNRVYLDDGAARRSGFPGIVAPPGMLRTWTMVPPPEQMVAPPEEPGSVYGLLEGAGYSSKAATNCDQRFLRYLRPGDEIRSVTHLTGVSGEKRTRLGRGFFVDSTTSFHDGDDLLVAEMDWRSLRYRPGPPGAGTPAGAPVTTGGADDRRPPADGESAGVGGAAPPPWPVPITPTLIIGGAMASRDYQDVHHDRDQARRRGAADIFTNMMTTAGLVSRYVTDWTGPDARLLAMSLTLGAPNHPGDTMVMTAAPTAGRTGRNGDGACAGSQELAVTGSNRLGRHVYAEVTFARWS